MSSVYLLYSAPVALHGSATELYAYGHWAWWSPQFTAQRTRRQHGPWTPPIFFSFAGDYTGRPAAVMNEATPMAPRVEVTAVHRPTHPTPAWSPDTTDPLCSLSFAGDYTGRPAAVMNEAVLRRSLDSKTRIRIRRQRDSSGASWEFLESV